MQTLTVKARKTYAGVWHNEHGSQVDFEIWDDGRVTGTLSLSPSAGGVQERYPLTGFANDHIITFCVNFGIHDSMTSWVGQIDELGTGFETMWHLVTSPRGESKDQWRAVLSGSDTFSRGACPENLIVARKQASHPRYCSII